jgi:hypothetical protein
MLSEQRRPVPLCKVDVVWMDFKRQESLLITKPNSHIPLEWLLGGYGYPERDSFYARNRQKKRSRLFVRSRKLLLSNVGAWPVDNDALNCFAHRLLPSTVVTSSLRVLVVSRICAQAHRRASALV